MVLAKEKKSEIHSKPKVFYKFYRGNAHKLVIGRGGFYFMFFVVVFQECKVWNLLDSLFASAPSPLSLSFMRDVKCLRCVKAQVLRYFERAFAENIHNQTVHRKKTFISRTWQRLSIRMRDSVSIPQAERKREGKILVQ